MVFPDNSGAATSQPHEAIAVSAFDYPNQPGIHKQLKQYSTKWKGVIKEPCTKVY